MQDKVNTIADIGSAVYDQFNVNCRQYGALYIQMVLTMAIELVKTYTPAELTAELQAELTENNLHQENQAIDIIKHLAPLALYEFSKGGEN